MSLFRLNTILLVLLIGTRFSSLASAKTVTINWSPIRGAIKYELHVKLNEKVVVKEEIDADSTSWSGEMPAGVYLYQIRGIDRLKQPGKWSEYYSFIVSPAAPEALEPEHNTHLAGNPTADVTLRWSASQGATKYVVELKQEKKVLFKKTTSEREIEANDLPLGKYTWTVRAIVELKGTIPKGVDLKKAEGPPFNPVVFYIDKEVSRAIATAQLSATAPYPRDSRLWLDVNAAIGLYKYESTAIENPKNAPYTGAAGTIGYFLSPACSASLSLRDTFYKVSSDGSDSVAFDRKEIDLMAHYKWQFASAWRLHASLGGSAREYFSLARPTDPTVAPLVFEFFTGGLALKTEVQYSLSKDLLVGVGGEYYHPITTIAPPRGAKLTTAGSNFAVGASGSYFMDPSWALRTEITYQKRSLDFEATGSAANQNTFSAWQLQLGIHMPLGGAVD